MPSNGGCWQADADCASVTVCADDKKLACFGALLQLDCATKKCVCPTDHPVWCAAAGAIGAGCWGAGIDCATRVLCAGQVNACPTGAKYDCGSAKCITPVSTVPAWLVGTYARYGKTENNIHFDSDNRSITFAANETYTQTLAKSTASSGKFNVAGSLLTFTTGPLAGAKGPSPYSLATLKGWKFTKSLAKCPLP